MTETRTTAATGGQKGVKPEQFHTMPAEAVFELARVYSYGAGKYADYNFHLGYEWSKTFNAMMRHAWLFWSGETYDKESGLNHMAHVAWHAKNLVMYSQNYSQYGELDDRPTGPAAEYQRAPDLSTSGPTYEELLQQQMDDFRLAEDNYMGCSDEQCCPYPDPEDFGLRWNSGAAMWEFTEQAHEWAIRMTEREVA